MENVRNLRREVRFSAKLCSGHTTSTHRLVMTKFITMLSGARFPAETNEILVSAAQPRSPNPVVQRMVRLTIVEVPLLSPPTSGGLTNLKPYVRGLEPVVQRQVHLSLIHI